MNSAGNLPSWAADILDALPLLLEREDAARRLNMSMRTLDRRIRSGRLVALKDGGRVVIPRRSIVDMLVASAEPGA